MTEKGIILITVISLVGLLGSMIQQIRYWSQRDPWPATFRNFNEWEEKGKRVL